MFGKTLFRCTVTIICHALGNCFIANAKSEVIVLSCVCKKQEIVDWKGSKKLLKV